jgi:hypothetical protein
VPITNDSQLTGFLNYIKNNPITNTFTAAQKAQGLMNYFTQADTVNPSPPPATFPCLGITDHGPGFSGVQEVTDFFTQLFASFPDMLWIWPPPPLSAAQTPRLVATKEIGIQMTVTGTYQSQWFQPVVGKKNHSSLPLSQLPKNTTGSPLGARKGDHNGTPAFAVFTFDGKSSCLINQLQIYLDRYAMMQTIEIGWLPDGLSASSPAITTVGAARARSITIRLED